jgi:hypothetical protein
MKTPPDNMVAHGFVKLTISKDHILGIYEALDLNNNDLIKAFESVWEGGCYFSAHRDQAGLILHTIRKIQAFITIEGRSPERVWQAFQADAKKHSFTRHVIPP